MMSESMTQMPPVVLAPSQSQKLFEGQQQARVCEPIFYSARDESITRRVRRRLGVSCVREPSPPDFESWRDEPTCSTASMFAGHASSAEVGVLAKGPYRSPGSRNVQVSPDHGQQLGAIELQASC